MDIDAPKSYIRVLKEVGIYQGNRHIRVGPHSGFAVAYTIDFPCPSIGSQTLNLSITPGRYMRELADARTFCMKRDIEAMQSRGLALGGSLENAVVYDDDRCLNESLRFQDEAVRHKVLDLVGDLALLGAPLMGRVEAFAAGHAMHVELAKKLLATPDAWTVETAPEAEQRLFHLDFAHGLAVV
jgi:UDP-3-O-[3-hydroxymyristoyl] N-acetylglucosamine deacetylase